MQEVEIVQPDISEEENKRRIEQLILTINNIVFSTEFQENYRKLKGVDE
jgi:hypothetical protein